MASNLDEQDMVTDAIDAQTWQLNALTAALGDLTLTVGESLSVGRGNDNDVVLGSKQVSRNHALLSVLNGKLYIKDLDSSNGTFINEVRIEGNKSKHLNADDTVGFASFVFQVAAPVVADANVAQPVFEDVATAATAMIEDTPTAITPVIETPAIVADETANLEVIDTEPAVVITESVTEKSALTEQHIATDIAATGSIKEPVAEPVMAEEVVKETIIEEVLSSAASDSVPVASQSKPAKETLASEPLIEEPVIQKAAPTATAPEHDKTTKTQLQEEADPDILRAKQAATGQLSGTANLGQAPDIGTEGNNAMSQALNNPANAGHVEKKPSGGWFIWVFVAIVILGLALWLFNMGG